MRTRGTLRCPFQQGTVDYKGGVILSLLLPKVHWATNQFLVPQCGGATTKEKWESANQYCCCVYSLGSPCEEAKTNKQGQLASKSFRLWESRAEGFISGDTESSLNVKHLETHWPYRGDAYSILRTHWSCTIVQTPFLMMMKITRVTYINQNPFFCTVSLSNTEEIQRGTNKRPHFFFMMPVITVAT